MNLDDLDVETLERICLEMAVAIDDAAQRVLHND